MNTQKVVWSKPPDLTRGLAGKNPATTNSIKAVQRVSIVNKLSALVDSVSERALCSAQLTNSSRVVSNLICHKGTR